MTGAAQVVAGLQRDATHDLPAGLPTGGLTGDLQQFITDVDAIKRVRP